MTKKHENPRKARRGDRADRGPGAHSGREQQAGQRTVPGTASAAEGYDPHGTGAGEPLKGREKDEED
ncbi:hypothetical protein ACWD0A_12825 [Streptomyces sp. NPDC002867]